ncbi:hypothetical protein [Gracilibacillus saliphilus]|uniref:hypothetical protein n=1 Tax=Gracilibacillus saliphilus TaxID=543890 RepID=UPI0013D2DB50|nr:hypothetical protein [Gracilibacillus saliphilus]
MADIQENTNSNHKVEEEGVMSVANQANDEEWNQFIKRELEKQKNQEEGNKELLPGKDDILNSIIEKIPVEDLLNATINTIKEKVETEIKRRKKKKQPIEQKAPVGQIKNNEDTDHQKSDRTINNKKQIYKTRQKERLRELYRIIYG